MSILIDFIVSIVGGVIAGAILEALKNKKNNRPEPDKSDDGSSY